MKYCIIGAGGTGGAIAASLAMIERDVTLIARGENLEAMRENGTIVTKEELDGSRKTYTIDAVKARDAEEYVEIVEKEGAPDVIFICTKTYSIPSVAPLVNRVADDHTIVIPILNGLRVGDYVRSYVTRGRVLDGCIYIVAQKEKPGHILIRGDIFRIVFGTEKPGLISTEEAEKICEDLEFAGIRAIATRHILRDTFRKFSYVAVQGAVGLYYGDSAGIMKQEGEARDMFIELVKEVQQLGDAMGAEFNIDLVEKNLEILANVTDDTTTSMQRDVLSGHESEFDMQVCQPVRLGKEYGVAMNGFARVARKFPELCEQPL